MSSANLKPYDDQNRETSSLERQTVRADQCGIVNSKAAGNRISRIADWISRKVNMAGNVLARYRSIDSSADNSTLLLASAIKPGDELQVIDDSKTAGAENTLSQSRDNGFKSPAGRIAARANESGLIRGSQIQRKADQAMEFTSERMTSVNRLLQRSSLAESQDLPVISAGLLSPMESQPPFHVPSENQFVENRNSKGDTGGVQYESSLNDNVKPVSNSSAIISPAEIRASVKNDSPLLFRSLNISEFSDTRAGNSENSGMSTRRSHLLQTEISKESLSDNQKVFRMPTRVEQKTETGDSLSTIPDQGRRGNSSNDNDKHSERIFRSIDANGSSIGESAGSVSDKNSSAVISSPQIKVSGEGEGTLVYRAANVNGSSNGESAGSISDKNSFAVISSPQTKIPGEGEGTLVYRAANVNGLPIGDSAGSKSDIKSSTVMISPQMKVSGEGEGTLVYRAANVSGSPIGDSAGLKSDIKKSPEIKVSEINDGARGILVNRSVEVSKSENVTNRLLSRTTASNINKAAALPVSVAPVVETTHSSPVDLIWRKSDSEINAYTNRAAGGVKDIRTIPGSILSRKEESGAGSGQGSQSGIVSENKTPATQNAVVDIEEIAEQLERMLSRRMIIERERRGEYL